MQLANELRRPRLRRLRRRRRRPSTKCSSRTNCDLGDDTHPHAVHVRGPSTKCSSRTNCDARTASARRCCGRCPLNEVQLANELRLIPSPYLSVTGRVDPQRSAARERTATGASIVRRVRGVDALNEVQLANELRPRACFARTMAIFAPQRSAARERTATGSGPRTLGRRRLPSTKCSSRTNCDANADRHA